MRKVYLVPNFITTAGMFCGFYSIISAIHEGFSASAWAIVAAGIFDALDGRIARLAKATSQFGVEYDSLSDLVSFGIAPSVLFYQWALEPYERLGWLASFLFVACGALRLARFNINTETSPKNYFQGLPITLAGGVVSTFVIFSQAMDWSGSHSWVVLLMTFALASLMVSTVQFPSFKEMNWRSRATSGYVLLGVVSMILIAMKPEVTLFLLLSGYISISLCFNFVRFTKQKWEFSRGRVESSKSWYKSS